MFEQITIIIPTYNRYSFLKRGLEFYLSYNLPYSLMVLDSSSEEGRGDYLAALLNDPRVSYYRYSPDTFIGGKIGDGALKIRTDYCAFCGDDDFLVPEGLKLCVEYLKEHNDYSSAHGLYISHKLENGRFKWAPIYVDAKSNTVDDRTLRLRRHLSDYTTPTFYAVHRTATLRDIWQETAKYTSCWGLFEVFPSALDLISGKMKILPVFYASRESNDSDWYADDYEAVMYSEDKCARAIFGMCRFLMKETGMTEEECRRIAEESLNSYLHPVKDKKPRTPFTGMIYQLFGESLLTEWILGVHRFKNRVKHALWMKPYRREYSLMFRDKSSPFHDDFKKIKESVRAYQLASADLNTIRKEYSVVD